MAQDLVVRDDIVIPASELEESASRAGGPGGQHVNKTATRISLRWNVRTSSALTPDVRAKLIDRLRTRLTAEGDLIVVAAGERSQLQNRLDARERLAGIVARALVDRAPRVDTKPTRSSQRRRVEAKKRRSGVKRSRGAVGHDD